MTGEELRTRIERLGLTYVEAAQRIGLSHAGLQHQMRGERPVGRQTEMLLEWLEMERLTPRRAKTKETAMTTTIYDPVEITCLEARLAVLKRTLNQAGAKMTCAKAAEAIGLSDEWSHDDREKFSMICQSLYEREYHCGAYKADSWNCITTRNGNSGWDWSNRHWDWQDRQPPTRSRHP